MTTTKYVRCGEKDIPANVRFDVPRARQGQIVEVAYGGFSKYEHDDGAPFMRRHDKSLGESYEFYKLA